MRATVACRQHHPGLCAVVCCWILLSSSVSGYIATKQGRGAFGGVLSTQRSNNNFLQQHGIARSRTSSSSTFALWQHHQEQSEVMATQRSRRSLPRVAGIRNRISQWMPSSRNNNNKQRNVTSSKRRRQRYRRICLAFASLAVSLAVKPTIALAMGAMGGSKGPVAPVSRKDALSLFGVFFALFLGLALLHAAEIAITTLYPWKVREFAEEVSFRRVNLPLQLPLYFYAYECIAVITI